MIRTIRLLAATAIFITTVGCVHHSDQPAPAAPPGAAPVTTIYYLPQAPPAQAPPTSPAASAGAPTSPSTVPAATAGSATPATPPASVGQSGAPAVGPSTQAMATDPHSQNAAPSDQVVTALKYRIDRVDRHQPAQVAWAYTTLFYTRSETDPPGVGNGRAADFATPGKAAALLRAAIVAAETEPAQAVTAAVIITKIDVFAVAAQATAVVTATVQRKTTTTRGSTTIVTANLTLQRQGTVWAVTDDHSSTAN